MRALYVGRDAAFAALLEQLLVWDRHELRSAGAAAEALALHRRLPADFVVIDLELLGGEGRPFLRAMTPAQGGRKPFFLLLTSPQGVASLPPYVEAGAQHFAVKPVEPKELILHVARADRWVRDQATPSGIESVVGPELAEKLLRSSRALRALRSANAAVAGAADEGALLSDVCRALVREGGYRMAWVGYALDDEARSVKPVAAEGFEEGYLENARISWSDQTERGRGPTGRSIREARTVWAKNIPMDPAMAPWREQAMARGYASSIALPLRSKEEVLGALMAYAVEPEAFDADEVSLLEAVASDLSFGIVSRRALEERERAAKQMASTDRLMSMGMLAAGVAHEINNPLAYLVANLSFVRQVLKSDQPIEGARRGEIADAVEEAADGADRLRTVVQDIKTFSRPEAEESAEVDVRQILEASIRMAWGAIRGRARLVKDLGEVPRVAAVPQRLGQVFLNVLVNAAQSISEGNADQNEIRVSLGKTPEGRVQVAISDTGCGIPQENLPKVFEPFFTTKPPSIGTGLGLPICREIVRSHGGEIALESEVGKGTICRITLPASARKESRPGATPAPEPPTSKRRGRILVVDDEPLVGQALRRILKEEHDVTVTYGAREAIDLIRAGGDFDVILSDCLMPGMTGVELYAELERTRPGLAAKMVFLSGMGVTEETKAFFGSIANPRLEKPFLPGAVRECVRKLVG